MTARPPLVLLVHRIPYPPDKGDKIRSFHLLQFLARHYEIHLGAFVDDAADWQHADTLRGYCADLYLEPLRPLAAKLRALTGFLRGQALTIPWYATPGMRRWVGDTARATGADRLLVFSSAMAQYADAAAPGTQRVLDMVDVDSDKWRQYADRRSGPAAWLYHREARRLLEHERRAAIGFDATTLVSPAEVALFRELCPEAADRVIDIGNGVDTDYFDPDAAGTNPYPEGDRTIVFPGAMDYWPNIDAVRWFAGEILPRIREREPRAVFHIVGARPADAVRALADRQGVRVAGTVADMRPWLGHAQLVVAPLRVARGIQNKVLEGFAMARPVLATTAALDGLDLGGDYPLRADSPEAMTEIACSVLAGQEQESLGARMRAWVRAEYAWDARLGRFIDLLEGVDARAGEPAPEVAAAVAAAGGGTV